jgi:hypothetical protein
MTGGGGFFMAFGSQTPFPASGVRGSCPVGVIGRLAANFLKERYSIGKMTAFFSKNLRDGSQYVDTFVALKKLGACTSLKTAESLFYTLIQRFKSKIFFKLLRKFYE